MRARGLTLVENLVALGFFSAVSLATLLLLASALRIGMKSEAVADLHTEVVSAMSRLLLDLQETRAELVVNRTSDPQPVLAFATARDSSGTVVLGPRGTPAWQAWVLYYVREGELLRLRVDVTPVDGTFDPTPFVNGTGRRLAGNVQVFHVSTRDGALPGVQVRLRTSAEVSGVTKSFELSRWAVLARDNGLLP